MKSKILAMLSTLLAVVLLGSNRGWAKVIHVPTDKPTIQSGIVAAANGDIVEVAPGTYFENIDFMGKAIEVKSSGGPKVTTIDGGHAGSVITFASGETTTSVLAGFTITNGLAYPGGMYDGGGIRIGSASPTIYGNTITGNGACDGGGGIAVSFGSPVIKANIITNNSQMGCSGGVGGGGISLVGAASAQILYNTISNNTWSSGDGGGISLFAAGTPLIMNNLISGNTATGTFGGCFGGPTSMGGGVTMVNDSDAIMVQNLIINNNADIGGGVAFLVPSGSPGPLLVNNTIANNSITQSQGSAVFSSGFGSATELVNNLLIDSNGKDAVYCDNTCYTSYPKISNNDAFSAGGKAFGGGCAGYIDNFGNISAQPLFANPAQNNFNLLAGSPGIDVGLNSAPDLPPKDISGQPRIVDGDSDGDYKPVIDMGAYEFQPVTVTPTVLFFGMHPLGSHTSKPVTLTNHQKISLTVNHIATSGDFSQSNDCPGSLPAGKSCTITVTFTPTTTGLRSGVLTVNDNDPNGPRKVALSGNGPKPTATATHTASPTPTRKPTPTPTRKPTPTPTRKPTPTPTHKLAPTPTHKPTPTATP